VYCDNFGWPLTPNCRCKPADPSDVFHSSSKADATGLDPVEEADMNNIKTTGR